MKRFKKKAILYSLGIIGVFALATALYLANITNEGVFIFAAIFCVPLFNFLWQFVMYVRRDTIRILNKVLPEVGFSVDDTEYDDKGSEIRLYGKFRGSNFMLQASHDSAYIWISEQPWQSVKSSDPYIPKYMEAINEVNACSPNISVVMCDPDDKNMRLIYTHSRTILPSYRPEMYLDHLMCDIMNQKIALAKAVQKDRPYMTQRQSPIGFNAHPNSPEN